MNDFFGNLGKKFTDTVDELGKKAEDTVEIQKIKNQIHSLDRENGRDYEEIGKKTYEHFKNGEVVNIDFVALCEKIEKREKEIEEFKREINRIKGV